MIQIITQTISVYLVVSLCFCPLCKNCELGEELKWRNISNGARQRKILFAL